MPVKNELSASLIEEFNERKTLSKLGYSTDIKDLDDFTANAFLFIAGCYSKEESDAIKKIKVKKPARGGRGR